MVNKLTDLINRIIIKRLKQQKKTERKYINFSQIRSLGIIVDLDAVSFSDVDKIIGLLEKENILPKILYLTNAKDLQLSSYKALKRNILGIRFVYGDELDQYRETGFDCVLVYMAGDVYALLMAAQGLKAKMTVGSDPKYADYFDFTVKTKNDTLPDFVNQTVKYLKTIKSK